ncbi:hypothetical protein ACSX1A_03135 [Pontibacter sp. MBLB2868]|uniref:hypothetical protein n=1 Tax=Pontibacter sp. MBLB2868 TaxID=3451555 RepID=UPI003F751145
MKRRKEPTEPIACRVTPEQRRQLIKEADALELSTAEYVAMLVTLSLYGDSGVVELRERLVELDERTKALKLELLEEKELVWMQEPYCSLLQGVLKNDQILEEFYEEHSEDSFQSNLLGKAGFDFSVLLQGETIGNQMFYFTGRYGWKFLDASQKQVVLKRKEEGWSK